MQKTYQSLSTGTSGSRRISNVEIKMGARVIALLMWIHAEAGIK